MGRSLLVMDWFNLRQDLPLLDFIILLDDEAHQASGDHLRSDVDDVRLDKDVVTSGV